MKKLFVIGFSFLFISFGYAKPGKNHKNLHPSDKSREKYAKKLQKKKEKEQAAFLKKQHKKEFKKGKHRSKPGNSYETVK